MATPYRFKRSSISGKRPRLSDLEKGELALNFYDGHLFTEVDTGGVGIGTTISNLTPWKERFGGGQIDYSGIVTATTYHGDQIVGTPTVGSFRAGAMQSPEVDDKTKDQVEELNYILGKLVPNQPDTIDGVNLVLDEGSLAESTKRPLCAGFTPTNNTPAATAPSAGTAYYRNVDNVISTGYLTQYGPGDSGTINAYINNVGVGTTALNVSFGLYASKSDNGTYDKLQIANEKDAADSTRNTGIASNFYEVLDMRILSAVSPVGFNSCWIKHGASVTASNTNSYWYEEDSPPGVPDVTFSSVTAPSSPEVHYSSGVPHYKNHSNNSFSYVISVTNATGDMYYSTNNRLLWAENATTGFTKPDSYKLFNETYVSGVQGTHPPQRDWGVGTAATVTATHTPNNIHNTISSNHFHGWDCWTPYGSDQNEEASLGKSVNIMGTSARGYTDGVLDEDNITVDAGLGGGSGVAVRVNVAAASTGADGISTTWDATSTPGTHEAIVRGGRLRHDIVDYSNTSNWLPAGPDLSSGRTGDQWFSVLLTRSAVSTFNITYKGAIAGCWVNLPEHSGWQSSLNAKNGWADMFQAYRDSGMPTDDEPGCSSGGTMNTSTGTVTKTCTFGTASSSGGSNKILILFKLVSGDYIEKLKFSA